MNNQVATDRYHEIIRELDKREREEGKFPLLFEFYRKLLSVQFEAKKQLGVPQPHLSKKDIDERVRNGLPVLRFSDLDLDWPLLEELFTKVVAVFRDYPQLFGDIPEAATYQITAELVQAWYEGTDLPESAGRSLMPAMLQATLHPFLRSYSEALAGTFDGELWRRGYCPACGGSPDFAFLDKEHGSRWLLCSRCDTRWLYKRLECPYCGNQDQKSLTYFTDDVERYRLYTCQRCQRYLKAVDLRKTEEDVLFPLERLLTVDMDRQAREKGFGNG